MLLDLFNKDCILNSKQVVSSLRATRVGRRQSRAPLALRSLRELRDSGARDENDCHPEGGVFISRLIIDWVREHVSGHVLEFTSLIKLVHIDPSVEGTLLNFTFPPPIHMAIAGKHNFLAGEFHVGTFHRYTMRVPVTQT
ncbi:C2 [Gull circovirus]|uniref:C2 n=1 Tax=Gull circovirus TaxID=400121 RepID=I3QHF3_9CIRC|nr:C2 [Gull circovirus]AMD39537.1 hypothetical protein [Gull circovirus]